MTVFRSLIVAIFTVGLLAVPSVAQAQGFSASIGTYSIPDLDGSATASVTVDPAGTGLAAIGIVVGYDQGLVSVTSCDPSPEFASCNYETPGEIVIQAVEGDGWAEPFSIADIGFSGLGVENEAPLTVTIDSSYDADLAEITGTSEDGSISVNFRAPSATSEASCEDLDGRFDFELVNPMDDPRSFVLTVNGDSGQPIEVASMESSDASITGVVDGMATVVVTVDGETILETSENVECDPEVGVEVTCTDGGADIIVTVINRTGGFATYGVKIGTTPRTQRSISNTLSTVVTSSVSLDGALAVVADRNGDEIYNETVSVECGNVAPTPVPVEPTPVPVEPTPTPVPNGPDAGVVEVGTATTSLADNGRIDTNIVNTGGADADYRVEFQGLTARQSTVGAGDWWRMPVTGRADGDYQVVVKRDGVIVSDQLVTVACDTEPPVLTTPEVQVVNACRDGNGYIMFQFANNTDASKSYIIEFEGVTNRSTSASAFGGAVRAVTGRPNNDYNVLIRNGVVPLMSMTLQVDCN